MIKLIIPYRFSTVTKPFYFIVNWATLFCKFDPRVLAKTEAENIIFNVDDLVGLGVNTKIQLLINKYKIVV